ncbi:SsgA family sporulation/cell division regulator [Streptomyces sp. NPDC102360]|uniref:SsgA family sporulation/cell division regulator n=1 Tax=Streptomyces sp. NPDC102360 TaxID=3366160 RepID=UPI00380F10BC
MHVVLELSARAFLVITDDQLPVHVGLRYSSAEPFAVHLEFPPHITLDGTSATWTFARVLLEEGLKHPAGIGEVRVAPRGRKDTSVELHSELGVAMLHFDTQDLRHFLSRTYMVVEPGTETMAPELDFDLAAIYGGQA